MHTTSLSVTNVKETVIFCIRRLKKDFNWTEVATVFRPTANKFNKSIFNKHWETQHRTKMRWGRELFTFSLKSFNNWILVSTTIVVIRRTLCYLNELKSEQTQKSINYLKNMCECRFLVRWPFSQQDVFGQLVFLATNLCLPLNSYPFYWFFSQHFHCSPHFGEKGKYMFILFIAIII